MKSAALLAFLFLYSATAPAQPAFIDGTPEPDSPVKKIEAQLDATIIPDFKTANATLRDAIELITKKAKAADPKHKPVPIVIDPDLLKPQQVLYPQLGKLPELRISLTVANITESELLSYITKLAGLNYRITFTGVSIEGCKIENQEIMTQRYSLPASFFGANGADDAKTVKALANEGVVFAGKASAHYDPAKKILTVRDTEENLALVDQIVRYWRDHGDTPK